MERHFYVKFNNIFALYLLARPFFTVIAYSAPPEERLTLLVYSIRSFLFVAHTSLVLLYVPNSKFNSSFPFHKNTSHMLGLRFLNYGDVYEESGTPKDKEEMG